jgi:hypothetical protein
LIAAISQLFIGAKSDLIAGLVYNEYSAGLIPKVVVPICIIFAEYIIELVQYDVLREREWPGKCDLQ